jgi:hypothetical protein
MVSHGPATIRPIMISRKPGTYAWVCPAAVAGRPCTTKNASSARPASSGSTRQARGGFGVARRVTPSGEICTRRSASRATRAAATGTPIATARMSGRLSDRSLGKNGSPVNGTAASGIRSTKNRPKPAATPAAAANVDSTAAMTEICRGRAPTRRIAANRCSRRAADSRVAVAMKISTGVSRASATTEKMRSTPPAPTPSSGGGVARPLGFLPPNRIGKAVAIVVTAMVSGVRASCAAVCPMMMNSESGEGSAA